MQPFQQRVKRHLLAASLLTITCSVPTLALADVPQNLSATVDGKRFESDNDSITYLMPRKGVLNLIAKTKGSSAYPPPKTPVDQLSIICNHFESKPVKFSFPKAGSPSCEVRFSKGLSKEMMGDPQAEYRLVDGNNLLEITSVQGKVIEGKFSFELIEIKTKARLVISGGVFKAEDRQL